MTNRRHFLRSAAASSILSPGIMNQLFAAGMLCGIAAPRAQEASVSFLGTDDTTQGSWKGVYGADGHAIPYKDGKMQGWAKLPDYASLYFVYGYEHWWQEETSDPRALERTDATDGRVAPKRLAFGDRGDKYFIVDVTIKGGAARDVSIYAVDWDRNGMSLLIEAADGHTDEVLHSQNVGGLQEGKYIRYRVKGRVKFKISGANGRGFDYAAVFFDGGQAPSRPADLALNKNAAASSGANPGCVTDGNYLIVPDQSCVWRPDGPQNDWLEVDLGGNVSFNKAGLIQESGEFANRITGYKIQYWNGSSWMDAYSGGECPGLYCADVFPPVTGSKARLLISSARGSAGLRELEIFNTGELAAVPPAPAPLAATVGGDGKIGLLWNKCRWARGYKVKRASRPEGPYETISDAVFGEYFNDEGLVNGEAYYYRVSAFNALGEGPDSRTAVAQPEAPVPMSDPQGSQWKVSANNHDLWYSDGISLIKGILLSQNYGWCAEVVKSDQYRRLATFLNCAIVFDRATGPSSTSPQTTLSAIQALAAASGHPELAHAPVFAWGHSNGTPGPANFAAAYPDRTFGWLAFRNAFFDQLRKPGAYKVPGLVLQGQSDVSYYSDQLASLMHEREQKRCLMAIQVEPGAGHGASGQTLKMVLAFIKDCYEARVPLDIDTTDGPADLIDFSEDQGWLGDNDCLPPSGVQPGARERTGYQVPVIAPYDSYQGYKPRASWMINETMARKWLEFGVTGNLKNWQGHAPTVDGS
jgi:hypothetical protein